MASTLDHAFFYNSENGDRLYDASSFEYWLKKFFTSGVFEGDCLVTASTGMTVTMAGGYANIDGKVRFFETAETLKLEVASATYDRIDTIVLERNDTERDITVRAVTGGYSSNPAATAPVRENGVYQLVIAQIYVAAGATGIAQTDITDTRTNKELCGVVTGAVEQYDIDQFKIQFDAWQEEQQTEFLAWFETIKGKLDGDLGASLQEAIDSLTDQVSTLEDALGGCSIKVVDALPDTPDYNTIYFIKEA